MANTCYDPSLDEEILKHIDDSIGITFIILFKILNENNLTNSKTTVSKHLKFLEDKKIIEWTRNSPGHKGSIRFTPTAKIEEKYYGFPTRIYIGKRGICKEWKKQNQINVNKERENKKILFLLLSASYGSLEFQTSAIPKPGDVVIKDSKGISKTVSISKEEGFSPSDLDKNESQFSIMRDYFNFDQFSSTKNEIEQIIKEINKDVPLRKIIGKDRKNIRYDIQDDVLKNLLILCTNILIDYVLLMQRFWLVTNTLPTKERDWFRLIVGSDKAAELFVEIEENKRGKESIKDLYIEVFYDGID